MYDRILVAAIWQELQIGRLCWIWPRSVAGIPLIDYQDRYYNVARVFFETDRGRLMGKHLPAPLCQNSCCARPTHRRELFPTDKIYIPQPYRAGERLWLCDDMESARVFVITADEQGKFLCDCLTSRRSADGRCVHIDDILQVQRRRVAS